MKQSQSLTTLKIADAAECSKKTIKISARICVCLNKSMPP